mgnify:CR=1 FL=1
MDTVEFVARTMVESHDKTVVAVVDSRMNEMTHGMIETAYWFEKPFESHTVIVRGNMDMQEAVETHATTVKAVQNEIDDMAMRIQDTMFEEIRKSSENIAKEAGAYEFPF